MKTIDREKLKKIFDITKEEALSYLTNRSKAYVFYRAGKEYISDKLKKYKPKN